MRRVLLCAAVAVAVVLAPRAARADDDARANATTDTEARAAAAAAAAAAADDEAKKKEEKKAESKKRDEDVEVRVIGKRADALQRVPGSGTVISSKDIQRAQPHDTAEMLRRVPGVQVRQDTGGGNRLDISIRGLDSGRSRRVLILEDGIPMAINPYSEPDMYFAPIIERYQGIEVVKGSGNILFGPQTLAGTINFLTAAPPEKPTFVADVDGGTYGYLRGYARYGDRLGNARYVVQVLERRGDGFRGLPFDQTDVLGKLSVPTGKDGEAMIKLGYHRDDAASDAVGLTPQMYRDNPHRTSLSPTSHLILNRYDVSITHDQRLGPSTKMKTLVYAYRTDRIWRRQSYTRAPVPGDEYSYIAGDTSIPGGAIYFQNANTVLDREYDVMGLEPRFEHRVNTGPVAHKIDFGGRVLHETAAYQQRTGGYAETYAGSLDVAEDHDGTAFAGYVQDRIAFAEDLLVTPGIRVEHFTFRRAILRQATSTGTNDTFDEGHQSVDGVIPGIGMTYGQKQLNVFGGVHVGWAPPRVTSAINARGVSSNVHAEKSINYELGTRTMPTKWSRLEATGYLSNFSNQVVVGTAVDADSVNLADAGATNLYGLESGMLVSFDKALKLPTIVELGARYTYAHGTFRYGQFAGNFLPYAPQHSFNANFDVEHRSGFGGQLAYAFVSSQFTDPANTVAENVTGIVGQIGPRNIFDATLHYKHKPSRITVRVTAKNVFDDNYIIARRPEGIFAGPFRQILVGLRWEWEGKERED